MKRIVLQTCLMILAAALLLLIAPLCAVTANAEEYNIGTNVPITLTYGSVPPEAEVTEIGTSGKYYKIASYVGSEGSLGGSEIPLLGGDGRVVAPPGNYFMNAHGNVNGTDSEGNVLPEVFCEGSILFTVESKSLELTVAANALAKTYGDEITTILWDYKNEADRDPGLTLVLSSAGAAPSAAVGSYDVTLLSATKNAEDVKAYYNVSVFVAGSSDAARVTVAKKELNFAYTEVREVEFNDFLGEDGQSVCSIEQTGGNGDLVTLYFRLTEAQTLLTVGESYSIEPYRYVVTPVAGEAQSYAYDAETNYAITADLSAASTVRAKIGSVTLFQDESKIEARASDPSFIYIAPSVLTMTYLDDAISNFSGTITFTDVQLYPNVRIDLTFSFVCASALVPAGEYALTSPSTSSPLFSSVYAEDLKLVVNKRVVGECADVVEKEYGATGDFVYSVERVFREQTYSFELTATMTGMNVGDERSFRSLVCLTDENVLIDYSQAKVKIVKRSTGIAIIPREGSDRVVYGDEISPCELYADHGEVGETLLESSFAYSYKKAGESQSKNGLPTQVGSYSVTCAVQSDRYAAEDVTFDMTVIKRPVVAKFSILSAKKTYGQTFVFSSQTAGLTALSFYDESAGAEDPEKSGLAAGDSLDSAIGGTGLTSKGGEKTAEVGGYGFDASGLVSPNYEVKKVVVYDLSEKKNVTEFIVAKADKPSAVTPAFEISGRAAVISAQGGETSLQAQLSEKSDFSSKQDANGTASAKFTSLKYGVTYYVRLRVSDAKNYVTAEGDWSEPATFAISFPKPTVKFVSATSNSLTFSADTISVLIAGKYVVQYKVGDGQWTEGLEIIGLSPDTSYTIRFRAYNEVSAGQEASLTERTLRAPSSASSVKLNYNEDAGTLKPESALTLEYRLLDEDNIVLEDWTDEPDFKDLKKGDVYYLEFREPALNGKAASEPTKVLVGEAPNDKAAGGNFFTDWYLLFLGGGGLLLLLIFLIAFIKVKKNIDRTELGGL